MPNNNNVSKYYKNESRRRRNESLRRRNIKKRLNGTIRKRRPVANGPSPLNPAHKRKNNPFNNILSVLNSLSFYE
jgi:hypothetical protein